MNSFKRKLVHSLVTGITAVGVADAAMAVSVSQNGLGQVLIFPYYTVRSAANGGASTAYNTLVSIMNSTLRAKAVKVNFMEGRNSRPILDFHLYLAPKDTWTVAIVPTASGAGIFTSDKSCTIPVVSNNATAPVHFVNYAYSGGSDDGGGPSLDRTREGFIEVIEMGDVIGATEIAVTAVNGAPPCTSTELQYATIVANTVAGSGGLFGSASIVNVLKGDDWAVRSVALASFSSTPIWFPWGDVRPNLANVNPKISTVASGGWTISTDWSASGNSVDAVSAVLMHDAFYNEFVLDAVTNSATDWVVTFPTKRFYYSGSNVVNLFQRNFGASGACDDILITEHDREARTFVPPGGNPPPPTVVQSLCWGTSIVSFNGKNALGSVNAIVYQATYANGQARLLFNVGSVPLGKHKLFGGASVAYDHRTGGTANLVATTFNGLPAIGFAATTYENGTLGGVQSNYGTVLEHRMTGGPL
jgi:hypothetical protein